MRRLVLMMCCTGTALMGLTLSASSAAAQTSPTPVDQAVADLDPLGRSLRQVQVGLRDNGEQTSLFAVPIDITTSTIEAPLELYQPINAIEDGRRFRYYRVGPGFRARVQRLDYIVRRGKKDLTLNEAPRQDGEFLEAPGIDAMYELSPISPLMMNAPTASEPLPPPSNAIPGRLNNQIDTRLRNQLSGTRIE